MRRLVAVSMVGTRGDASPSPPRDDRGRDGRLRSDRRDARRDASPRRDSATVFVGGLNFSTDDRTLRDACEAYGDLDSVKIIYDHDTRRSRGFAFVAFARARDARIAVEALDGRVVDGRRVRCNLADADDARNRGKSHEHRNDVGFKTRHETERLGKTRRGDEHDRRERDQALGDAEVDGEVDVDVSAKNVKRRKRGLVSDRPRGEMFLPRKLERSAEIFALGRSRRIFEDHSTRRRTRRSRSSHSDASDAEVSAASEDEDEDEAVRDARVSALESLLRRTESELRSQRARADVLEAALAGERDRATRVTLTATELRSEMTETFRVALGDLNVAVAEATRTMTDAVRPKMETALKLFSSLAP